MPSKTHNTHARSRWLVVLCCLFTWPGSPVLAEQANHNVSATRHNLSASGPGTVKAVSEDQICVFCHTPHGASVAPNAPLWNRELSNAAYTLYDSASLEAALEQPGGSSKLCLSCHDGALALGSVNFVNGVWGASIEMTGTDADGSMSSIGADTGFTRNLGTDLRNDHPISFTYDSALAGSDGELYDPATAAHIGTRERGQPKPHVPLEAGQVQCISCHDPHITNEKFLRLNRQQEGAHPIDGSFDSTQDILCLGCHDKAGWGMSAHSHSAVASETYTDNAADLREFPRGIQVWQASCLNCHDTHTVSGARMLLREGTDGPGTPKTGGSAAQEETCYQCHDLRGGANNILVGGAGNQVPDIKSEFARQFSKPITHAEQGVTEERHFITNHDMIEPAENLGDHRHAECTDCHNPHRIIRNQLFNANPASPDAVAHHKHDVGAGEVHSNILSGALAGSWGVEPVYGNSEFGALPIAYDLKSGYAGAGASTDVNSSHVTREYQICLKCHSSYAYGENPPSTGPSIGLNSVSQYTDQAMEFQAPLGDRGAQPANHRSWHPVIDSTGRDSAIRGGLAASAFRAPWNDDGTTRVGVQTMYCSDCHGSSVPFNAADPNTHHVNPPAEGAWGPHGADDPFILKGKWGPAAGSIAASSELCFRCHERDLYRNSGNFAKSGFSCNTACTGGGGGMGAGGCNMSAAAADNLHVGHAELLGGDLRCTWCHAAVPHGWRNKALLVDITNDPEAAACAGTNCSEGPYYQNAYLGGNAGGITWQPSGQWTDADCGGGGGGGGWMNNSCNAPQ